MNAPSCRPVDRRLAPITVVLCGFDRVQEAVRVVALRRLGMAACAWRQQLAVDVVDVVRSSDAMIVVVGGALIDEDPDVIAKIQAVTTSLLIAVHENPAVRLASLLGGADDAVSPELDDVEVAARCTALVRRARRVDHTWTPTTTHPVAIGPLVLDASRRQVHLRGVQASLTRIEFDLLEALCARPFVALSRASLREIPGWSGSFGDAHVMDVHMSNLRRKLADAAPSTCVVETVRGFGFRLSSSLLDDEERRDPARRGGRVAGTSRSDRGRHVFGVPTHAYGARSTHFEASGNCPAELAGSVSR